MKSKPAASFFWGHEYSIFKQLIGQWYSKWFDRLGTTYKIKAAWTEPDILVTVDPAALHHIYSQNAYNYEHSPVFRPLIKRLLGEGLVRLLLLLILSVPNHCRRGSKVEINIAKCGL